MHKNITSSAALDTLAAQLARESDYILAKWHTDVAASGEETTIKMLTRAEFYDHVPLFIERFCAVLRNATHTIKPPAQQHGIHRWQQGLDFDEVVLEWNFLHHVLFERITALRQPAGLDLKTLQRAYWLLADTVQKAIAASLSEFNAHQRLEAEARVRDLEAVAEQRDDLDLQRGQGLHQASHDLRGNLQVIRLSCHSLRRRPLDKTTGAIVERLWHAIDGLSQLFNDMLDLARLEAGREECQIDQFDAAAVLRELCETMQSIAESRGLALHVNGVDSLPVSSDAVKLRQIAQNLILNALGYTSAGSVEIGWQAEPPTCWSFYVRDSGPGMPKTTADSLAAGLEAAKHGVDAPNTTTANAAPVSRQTGTHGEGIGLSIVHRLCTLLNAVLEVDSESGQGTTFRVRLPM